jgi:hypothetical protein
LLLGIAVDDTIHFINHIKSEFDRTGLRNYGMTMVISRSLFRGGIDGRGEYAVYEDLSCVWLRGIYRF